MLNGSKRCPACGETKPRGEFGTTVKKSTGKVYSQSYCRPCASRSATAWCKANPERRRTHKRSPTLKRAVDARYYAANRERRRQQQRQWYQRNQEAWRQHVIAWRKANTVTAALGDARKRARKMAAQVVPFTEAQLLARLSMFPGCWMCGGPKETVDHVKPLAKGGLHVLANLRPACRSCNSRKRDAWPFRPATLSRLGRRVLGGVLPASRAG